MTYNGPNDDLDSLDDSEVTEAVLFPVSCKRLSQEYPLPSVFMLFRARVWRRIGSLSKI